MSVDRNEKIWAVVNGGAKLHAFVQAGREGRVRAMCRESYQIVDSALMRGLDDLYSAPCTRCLKLAEAMWDRAEASMAPVDTHENPTASQDYYGAVADESAVIEALSCPAVMDALHDEALAMDREMDKRQAARKALTARERASVSTDPDGSISGSFSAMRKLYDSGLAEVDPETGELVWAS
jgi:hypothetical protein